MHPRRQTARYHAGNHNRIGIHSHHSHAQKQIRYRDWGGKERRERRIKGGKKKLNQASSQIPKTGRSSAIYSRPLSGKITSEIGVWPSCSTLVGAVTSVASCPDEDDNGGGGCNGGIVPPGEQPTGIPVVVSAEIVAGS